VPNYQQSFSSRILKKEVREEICAGIAVTLAREAVYNTTKVIYIRIGLSFIVALR
jgi:hypothetical protein